MRLCILVCLLASLAAGHGWYRMGLDGQTVLSINATGEGTYAATLTGLYHKASVGWETLYVYGPRQDVRACVRVDGSVIHLAWGWGSRSDGLWRSSDGGLTWEVIRWMLYPRVFVNDGSRMYLASDTLNNGLWFSSDQGGTWSRRDSGLPETNLYCLTANARAPESLACGTKSHGLWMSADTGRSWQHAGPVWVLPVTAVSWPWYPAANIFIGVGGDGDSAGIWRSTNSGATWEYELAVAHPTSIEEGVLAGFLGDSGVYCRLFDEWVPFCDSVLNRKVHCLSGVAFVWAGTEDGVFYYDDFMPGTEDSPAATGLGSVRHSVVRKVLSLPAAQWRAAEGELLDIAGRKVMTVRAGDNDLSRLGPGVYLARMLLDERGGRTVRIIRVTAVR